MAISEQNDTLTMLNRWQDIMHVEPWHFNQIIGLGAPKHSREVWINWEREIVAGALRDAIDAMSIELTYYPIPVYVVNEEVNLGKGAPWTLQHLTTEWKHIQAFGVRTATLIEAGADVTYSEVGNLGVDDTATITVTTTFADSQIQVFFQVADGAPAVADTLWRIEPVTITDNGDGTKTITGKRWLFVKPNEVWDTPYNADSNFNVKNEGDTETIGDFVTDVDVYQITTAGTAGQVAEDQIFYQSTALDTDRLTTVVCRIVNREAGIFEARIEGTNTVSVPEKIFINYLAGLPLVNNQMDTQLARAITRFANTLVGHKPAPLSNPSNNIFADDNLDPSETNPIQARYIDNDFGLKKGQVAAWKIAMKRKRLGGGAIGRS